MKMAEMLSYTVNVESAVACMYHCREIPGLQARRTQRLVCVIPTFWQYLR